MELTYEDNLEFSSKMHACEAYRNSTQTCAKFELSEDNDEFAHHCNIIDCIKRGEFESSRMRIENKGW